MLALVTMGKHMLAKPSMFRLLSANSSIQLCPLLETRCRAIHLHRMEFWLTAKKQEKNMNKRVIALVTLVFVTISAYSQALSQSRCTLTEANFPSVRGLRLGMTTEQFLALFPGIAKRLAKEPKNVRDAFEKAIAPTSSEPAYLVADPGSDAATDAAKAQFAGVNSVSVGIYKGRVTDLSVQYVGVVWNSIDEWLAKVSEAFKLPGAREWAVGPSEDPNRVLKCVGLEIEAAIQGGGASIRVRNTEKASDDQTNSTEERKRRDFKP